MVHKSSATRSLCVPFLPVNPGARAQHNWFAMTCPRQNGCGHARGARRPERFGRLAECSAGGHHVVHETDVSACDARSSPDRHDAVNFLRSLSRRYSRPLVERPHLFAHDKERLNDTTEMRDCRARQQGRRLIAQLPLSRPMRWDGRPAIDRRRTHRSLYRLGQQRAQKMVCREGPLESKDQRLQRPGIRSDANECVKSPPGEPGGASCATCIMQKIWPPALSAVPAIGHVNDPGKVRGA